MNEITKGGIKMTVTAMTASEIAKKVINKEALFILDVRNEDAFEDWKIEGENIQYLNIPYFDFWMGLKKSWNQLPKDQDIVVVCAKEGSSIMIAEMLDGRRARSSLFGRRHESVE